MELFVGWLLPACRQAGFITICTHNKNKFLGKIVNGKMELSKSGKITEKYLIEIPKHFPEIRLDEYILMPNHMHILFRVETPDLASLTTNKIFKTRIKNIFTPNIQPQNLTDQRDFVETPDLASLQPSSQIILINYSHRNHPDYYGRLNQLSKQLIPKVVQQFKSSLKRECNRQHLFFTWQSRYYDHIIRSEAEYLKIKRYIIDNPINWEKDKFY